MALADSLLASGSRGKARTHPLRLVSALAAAALLASGALSPWPSAAQQVRPEGRFEDTDVAVLYGGPWDRILDAWASGGTYTQSRTQGAAVQLAFPGPNVHWVTVKGPNRGIARISIDGVDKGTVDLFAPAEQLQQEFSWGGLAGDQSHTLRIEVMGQRSGPSSDSLVVVDHFVVSGAVELVPLRFENTDAAVIYSGTGWSTVTAPPASGGSVHQARAAGNNATYRFSGPNVRLITTKGPNRGIVRIYIDDKEARPGSVDLYAPNEQPQVELSWGGLEGETEHLIRIEVTGTRSGPATDSLVDVDAFVVLGAPVQSQATATPSTTPTATSTTAAPTATATWTPQPEPTLAPGQALDFDVPGGHWYTQTNSRPLGQTSLGFAVTNETGVRLWDEFNRLGGVLTLGFPASFRYTGGFKSAGPFVYQVTQGGLLQWWPERGEAMLANIFQIMEEEGLDEQLYTRFQIPRPIKNDGASSFEEAVRVRLGWMTDAAIRERYYANPNPSLIPQWSADDSIRLYGLPMSLPERQGPFVVQRFQRIAFQHWVEAAPGGPPPGTVVRVLGGDMLKEFGLVPREAAGPRAQRGN